MWRATRYLLRGSAAARRVHPSAMARAGFLGGEMNVQSRDDEHDDYNVPRAPVAVREANASGGADGRRHKDGAHRSSTRVSYPMVPPPPPGALSSVVNGLEAPLPPWTVRHSSSPFPATAAPHRTSVTPCEADPLPHGGSDASLASAAPVPEVRGRQLWAASKLARENKNIRRTHGVCVVGGEDSIQRIWHTYGIRPNVVFVPDVLPSSDLGTLGSGPITHPQGEDGEASTSLPAWCTSPAAQRLPTCIVRCPPVAIQRQLLHASLSTPYAAEFPWHASQLLPLSHALHHTDAVRVSRPVGSMLVLVGLRIPSNVGSLIHAAESMGFTSVALIHCVDAFQEKVLRASHGSVLSPSLQLYEYSSTVEGETHSVVPLLSMIAAQNNLLPFLAVPSQTEEPAFRAAKRFHAFNVAAREASDGRRPLKPMLVLGGEAQGLAALAEGNWSVPFSTVTLPILNATVDSLNVAVAGSILMDLLRPTAEAHFSDLVRVTGEAIPASPLLHSNSEES